MSVEGTDRAPQKRRARTARLVAAVLLFATGYAIANRYQITHNVLYRFAASDAESAVRAGLFLVAQAAILFAALALLPGRWAALLLAVAGGSILVNHGYSGIVGEQVDGGTLAWMIAETGQAGNAAGEFIVPLLLAGMQTAAGLMLLATARGLVRSIAPMPWGYGIAAGVVLLLTAPSILYRHAEVWPEGAERNIPGLGWDLLTAPPPPPREAPALAPDGAVKTPRHIVWLIDESVAAAPFARLIAPKLAAVPHLDFGTAAAMGHCSAPAQVALRSGVDVRRASPATDLRRSPSIWAYAKRAGYRTTLIDGQTAGAPQNLMLAPELALIDDYREMPGGIDTDLKIADVLNRQMRGDARTFTYVVLRGVHFQYRDHYPAGSIPEGSPVALQYDTALQWSKGRFFERLLAGVDREAVAIIYTSDHGQNLAPGELPHCSREPVADEYRIPLLAFLPDALSARYGGAKRGGHSASQIFPATLGWMGYDRASAAALYDHDLTQPTARYVTFGRTVIPMGSDTKVSMTTGSGFPGSMP
jgi:hypothetical protein